MTRQSSIQLIRSSIQFQLITIMFVVIVLNGCAHNANIVNNSKKKSSVNDAWVQEVLDYPKELPSDYVNQIEDVLSVNETMRNDVVERFSHLPKHKAAKQLAEWLLDKGGLNMRYDVTANLTPKQAYEQRIGNCLSFTMLLTALANEIGINIQKGGIIVHFQTLEFGQDDIRSARENQ